MWLIFIILISTYSYQNYYMLTGQVKTMKELYWRVLISSLCLIFAFSLGLSIQNEKFWCWNPWGF
jgi:hypothetical protein